MFQTTIDWKTSKTRFYNDQPRKNISKNTTNILFKIETMQKNEEVKLVGFGTFSISDRKERTGRNPQTGEEILIPARKVPVFRPGKELKSSVN